MLNHNRTVKCFLLKSVSYVACYETTYCYRKKGIWVETNVCTLQLWSGKHLGVQHQSPTLSVKGTNQTGKDQKVFDSLDPAERLSGVCWQDSMEMQIYRKNIRAKYCVNSNPPIFSMYNSTQCHTLLYCALLKSANTN